MGRGLGLALLAGIAVVLWTGWRPGLDRRVGAGVVVEAASVPSPELADSTLDRFEAFRNGETGSELRLGDAELSSVVRYALPGALPPGVEEPSISLRDGRVHLGARLALAALPELPSLRDVLPLLPDTLRVEVRGTLAPFQDRRAALHVDRVEAARIPLPARLIPDILTALGRPDVEDLPRHALAIPLPQGLKGAFVLRDSLVLVANH